MTTRPDSSRLLGSFPPLVTPFLPDAGPAGAGDVDLDAYAALVSHHRTAGSHGVTVCGTTGEPSMLTIAERKALLDTALAAADGELPVIAATGSESLPATLELTAHAAGAGAAAVLVVTPYYSKPPARGLVAYFRAVADAAPGVPLLLYHIPGRAGVGVSADTVATMADEIPTLVGMKHASDDVAFVTSVLARVGDDFRIFVGKEDLSLPMMAIGACGLINAVGNLVPGEVARLADAVLTGDLTGARRLHDLLFELNQAVFWDTNPIPMKHLMMRTGLLPAATHRLPMAPADPALVARLDDLVSRHPLLGGR